MRGHVSLALSGLVAAAVALIPRPALAQVTEEPTSPYPDPRLFARGWFAEGAVGAAIPLGPARELVHAGPRFGVRAGYEIVRWVALQVHASGATHSIEAQGEGPQVGQLLQLTQVLGELRLAVPLGAWAIVGQGGAGRARFSTNVLGTAGLTDPGVRAGLVYGGSLGLDYHTRSRHFSAGLAVGFDKLPKLASTGFLTVALSLRYVF